MKGRSLHRELSSVDGTGPHYIEEECEERERIVQRHNALIMSILNGDVQVDSPIVVPWYYSGVLAYSLRRQIEEAGYKMVRVEGYRDNIPVYTDVDTGSPGPAIHCLRNGVIVLRKREQFLIVTIDSTSDPDGESTLTVTGKERMKSTVDGFAARVNEFIKKNNFYCGRAIQFNYRDISFIKVPIKSWEDVIISDEIKSAIRQNTVLLVRNRHKLQKFGVPATRGILLVGEPGVGKTLACKALLAEAQGMTCLTTMPGWLQDHRYIHWLYRIARDLAPTIVFLDDINTMSRETPYGRNGSLLTLLSILDGIEAAQDAVITIATTNDLETIDKAISKRPARFDVLLHFGRPTLEQRAELISRLCRNVPLDSHTQKYLAEKTQNFTPACIQEVIFTLVISYCTDSTGEPKPECLYFSKQELDLAIAKSTRDHKQPGIGFMTICNQPDKYNMPVHSGNQFINERSL